MAQETFIKATRALLGWRGESPAGWLLSIARNTLIDHARRHREVLPLPELAELGVIDSAAEQIAVRDALRRLPPPSGQLLEWVYLDGFALAEVAAMTSRSIGSIKTAVWRARTAFAETYGEH